MYQELFRVFQEIIVSDTQELRIIKPWLCHTLKKFVRKSIEFLKSSYFMWKFTVSSDIFPGVYAPHEGQFVIHSSCHLQPQHLCHSLPVTALSSIHCVIFIFIGHMPRAFNINFTWSHKKVLLYKWMNVIIETDKCLFWDVLGTFLFFV